jgi:hypothetical protein
VAATDTLFLTESPGVVVVQFNGRAGRIGIPSWKAILRRDAGGNISELHVPADNPAPLGSRVGQWPLSVIVSHNVIGVEGTMTRGRESDGDFQIENFEVTERSPAKVVVQTGGPSPHKHFEEQRTYTFTPKGIQVEGEVVALIDIARFGFNPHWDRTQLDDSHIAMMPLRTQGKLGWHYLSSAGSDESLPLPAGVDYPLEAELKLRQAKPTFVRIFFDQNFGSPKGNRVFLYNDKDDIDGTQKILLYEKLTCFGSDKVPKGERRPFKARFEFETRP